MEKRHLSNKLINYFNCSLFYAGGEHVELMVMVMVMVRGFQIGVTLDALLTFLKSGDFSGHLKEV